MGNNSNGLQLDDYQRYGRQMVLDGFGLSGQMKLQQSAVVVVGAGGLGCAALQYLASAGIGQIGIVDYDVVELSNLQRQVLYDDSSIGMHKATLAAQAVRRINPRVKVDAIREALLPSNAIALLRPYDIILDCTDNAPTRYLLSDAAVILEKPLVSGAAQKYDGQLCTYNYKNGPCYRCLFPIPPLAAIPASCEETGILGPVTGIIGNMQALETIKILVGLHDGQPSLLLFSALSVPPFRSVRLRSRKSTCVSCGRVGQTVGQRLDTDYVQFCGGPRPDWKNLGLVEGVARVTAMELKKVLESNSQTTVMVIDVRSKTEFGICHLPESINIPLPILMGRPSSCLPPRGDSEEIYVVCRLGNDSQIAAEALRKEIENITIKDVIGGLRSWSKDVDTNFPIY